MLVLKTVIYYYSLNNCHANVIDPWPVIAQFDCLFGFDF